MNIHKIESNIDSDILRIELFLSNQCNYSCWYCFPGFNEGTHLWPKLDKVIPNLSHLLDYYKKHKNKKRFILHIIGGEPTLWKDLGKFVQYFKENYNVIISMSSNGSRTLRWWEKYGEYFDHVILSTHHERADVPHIRNVADILYKKKVWVNATVLMDQFAWDKCLDNIEQLRKSKFRWPITAIAVDHQKINYTPEQKQFFKFSLKRIPWPWYYIQCKRLPHKISTIYFNNGKKKKVPHNWMKLNGYNFFKGWDCNIGIDTMFIDKNGELRGACGSKLFNLDFHYNIFDDDFVKTFNPDLQPQTCPFDCCKCMPEINCSKELKDASLKEECQPRKYTNLSYIPLVLKE